MDIQFLNEIMLYFGKRNQVLKAIEELSELQKELCKALLTPKTLCEVPTETIIDELADVEIMCEQLRHIFDISKQVDERKIFKIERLEQRLNETT